MAASVDNGHFTTSLNGVVRSLKPGTNHRSGSPARNCNFSSPVHELTQPKKAVQMADDLSSEDDEDENDYKALILKGNNELEPSILDPRDEGTADNWIERNPSMIRLTGKHPFNSEPPLNRLMHHGFITPVSLHYVRNHGYVPKANWDEWTVEVTGLVKRPTRFTMDQLANDFPSREFPVTLVCAGNRRKEQNLVKQTIGFNWGASGVSTSVWRGVPLRILLKRCGIYSRKGGALNVCFEGAEDLPGGGGSKYGTSIRKEIAMDPSRDIILAYMQNGDVLKPDHGFPVRVIMPGFIGGRMVKWLKRIVVTTKESDNYYHYKDNRVLPSHVDAELANAEAWWYKKEYIINELNINSVITTPCHEEILPITSWTTQRPYTMRGYAYSGGGKYVTRVEVTMDGGETWHVCSLDHPEKPNKYGKYWCWCFWSVEVEVLDLLGAKEIAVRAWDETHNTQPEKLIWNLMGMMNNCWFRVKTNICKPHKGEIGIIFEHPTLPGNQSGGWMAKERRLEILSETQQALKKSVSSPFINTSSKSFSLSEVKKHHSPDSAWIIIHGHVYDCTRFLKDHPGGVDSILINAGTDCTEEFDAIHSDKAKKMLEDYRIGELITVDYSSDSAASSPNSSVHGASNLTHLAPITEVAPARPVALVPREIIHCKLIEKISLSHDVRLFRFALPSEDQVLGLPVGKHIFLRATIEDKLCMRAYTPTSTIDEVGHFDLVIKIYFKGVHPRFPNGGLLSQHLDSLPIGSILDVKGPLGHIEYNGRGNFMVHGKPKFAKKLAMLAGGTGITPIYQVVQAILKNPEDETEMYVVYANRTEEDILLKEEFDSWASKHDRLKVWYVIQESIREDWKYSVGFITESILRDHIPEGSNDTLALACGPPPMIQFAVQPNLEKMNYDVKNSLLIF
ncbi:Nitrate reductase 2 [Tripterygium wilfordii]|uniref:Nitrate reductase n=1 Tax=Tripterygium wilfordii TaxID=458696 RepID=A0A7J7D1P1_TRIWF|nr:nitrate reductase [NADH]-like [Tripterygium wilfordii]KAF5740285.1 Nitrate reductase 2 [Tripterygium wilfordii]